MDIYEIRRKNIELLVIEYKSAANLSRQLTKPDGQISTWRTGSKDIGTNLAREIEELVGKDHGWLDYPNFDLVKPSKSETSVSVLSEAESRMLKMWRGWEDDVKQYVFGQMLVADYTKDVMHDMFFIDETKRLPHAQLDNLIIDTLSETGEPISGKKFQLDVPDHGRN